VTIASAALIAIERRIETAMSFMQADTIPTGVARRELTLAMRELVALRHQEDRTGRRASDRVPPMTQLPPFDGVEDAQQADVRRFLKEHDERLQAAQGLA
jgi:hypothetical protein